MLRRILNADDLFVEVSALGEKLATQVMRKWLIAANRDVTNYQWRVVCNALAECSLPIFVKLVFAETCRWKSYSKPNDTLLATNVMDSIFKLFERIEMQVLQIDSNYLVIIENFFVRKTEAIFLLQKIINYSTEGCW